MLPAERPRPANVLLLGPSREAISGVSTHLNLLFDSPLAQYYALRHFQVGREGRTEGPLGRLARALGSPFALATRLLAGRIALVHINTSLNRRALWRDAVYLLVARLCGKRVVWQVHGGASPADFCPRPGPRRALAALLRLSDVVVVLSGQEFENYQRLLPGHPVRLIPNGVDPAPWATLHRQARPAGLPLRLLYLGRLAREKGLFETLHAVQAAQAQGVPVTLALAGGGPDELPLRRAVRDLGLEGRVRFVGPAFGEAKLKLFDEADVLILPSYAEGLPYALLEAMAAGLPAIATPVGAIPDVVIDGQHALLVPPRDVAALVRAMARLAANPAWLLRMGADARHRVATRYTIDREAREFARLYADCLPAGAHDALARP